MGAKTLINHTCGWYCYGGRHAVEVVAIAGMSPEKVAAGVDTYMAAYGWHVVKTWPAREADANEWRRNFETMGWGWDGQRRLQKNFYISGPVTAWLAIIEPDATTP